MQNPFQKANTLQACWLQPGSSQRDEEQALQPAARTDSIHPWTWRAPTSPGKRANTALLAQLGAKRAKAQLSKDLAHQDHDTTFTCSPARGAPEQEAPSPTCLLHHGEHLPALELWWCSFRGLMTRPHWEAEVRLVLSQISHLEVSSPSLLSAGSRVRAAPPGIKST